MDPVLAASSLRVDVGGVPAVDGLTFATTGSWILLLGAARALLESACGLRRVARGELRIDGLPPVEAVRSGRSAAALLDPPLPPRWTVAEYARWSARLGGHGAAVAAGMAQEALERLHLEAHARTRLGKAPAPVRRLAPLAAALATGARVLLIEDPVAGLPADSAHSLARAMAHGLADRRVALFAGRIPLESPLALAADEAIVCAGSCIAMQGAPAELAARERAYAVRVAGDVPAFAASIEARGGRCVVARGPAGIVNPAVPVQLSLELGDFGTREVFALALEANAVVLELRPISRAFA
jgi:ABC-type multidrug transport system ATPase subunit